MGGLYLIQPDGQTIKLVVSHHLPQDYTGATLRLGEGLSGLIAQTGQTMIIDDYQADRFHSLSPITPSGRRTLTTAPSVGRLMI